MCTRCLVILSVLASLFISSASAEIPRVISYQGKVTDAGGTPVADADYSMTFTIYDAASGGTSLWSSGAVTVMVSGGVFSVLLGESPQPALSLAFDADYWVATSIEGDLQSPRVRLGSVGYAYMASGIVPGTEMVDSRSSPIFRGTNNGTGAGLRGDSDQGIGVRGESGATDGKGVYGTATATTGYNYGTYGISESINGTGVLGEVTATTGINQGVHGRTYSTAGVGVYGQAAASTGVNYGIYGGTNSTQGRAVFGVALNPTGTNYGVYGSSNSSQGIAVYGLALATTGTNYGIYGSSNSADGFAGFFTGRTRVVGTNSPSYLLDVEGSIAGETKVVVRDTTGTERSWLGLTTAGGGSIQVRGPNGNMNFLVSYLSGYGNNGSAAVADSDGVSRAGMRVNAAGDGVVWGDTKSFRMANPNDPGTEIWYACIEGPEAAAYLRGTARLENGRAAIAFPEHFQSVAVAEGMTVQLTPWSTESEGLAVTKRSVTGIEVHELRNGTGTYDFDYTVMAVRKGHEDYQVIRPREEIAAEPQS